MKTLKLTHEEAILRRQSDRGTTWRLFDDKDIAVNDIIELIDKREEAASETWQSFGRVTVDQIVEKRLADVTEADLAAASYGSRDDMYVRMRQYYGDAAHWKTPVKIISYSFREQDRADEQGNTVREAKLFTDGGSRGNPGPSAAGYVVYSMDQSLLRQQGVYLGVTTNNQAEYIALRLGLESCVELGIGTVHVYMDSLLVVNQMNGRFKIKNRDLWPIHETIKDLLSRFERVSFAHVPRELNKAADAMVNRALDEHLDTV